MSSAGRDQSNPSGGGPSTSSETKQAQRRTAAATTTTASATATKAARSKAPTRSQRQVSDVEYSQIKSSDSDQNVSKTGAGSASTSASSTSAIKRQPVIKRPMRGAGAKSLDQSNAKPPVQAPMSATLASRQQATVRIAAKQHQLRDNNPQDTRGQPVRQASSSQRRSSAEGHGLHQASAASQPVSMLTAGEEDMVDNSVLVETADDEELVADSSSAAGGGGGGGGGGLSSTFPSSLSAGLTRNLIWAVIASTVGSSFQHGYNGGVVNAPEKLIGEWVNATYAKRHNGEFATEAQLDFIVALIVSIFCIGGCLGALLTAFVADRIGRKEGLMYNNIIVLIAAPMMASSKAASSYELLIAGRLLIGINAGLNAGLAPLYLNEIAPIRLRGALGTIYQLVITISILLSNIFGLPSLLGDADSWPILFVLPIIPAAFMLITLPHLCESPKHLILNQGRELQAQQALAWLRETGDVMEEMDVLRAERELQALQQRSIHLSDMLSDTSLRRPLTVAIVIMLSQQLSGINAVLFYSTSIFRDAGLSEQSAVRATLGMSAVNVAMTLVSLFLVDRAGRRTLHMTGLMGMAATCMVLAFCLGGGPPDASDEPGSAASSGLAVVAVYVFIAMFASGPGAIPWFLVAELFPSNARPLATSIAVAVNWLANFTVSLCFLPLSGILHGFTFVLFAILLVIFYLFTYYKVPETKGATAEEISAIFRR